MEIKASLCFTKNQNFPALKAEFTDNGKSFVFAGMKKQPNEKKLYCKNINATKLLQAHHKILMHRFIRVTILCFYPAGCNII